MKDWSYQLSSFEPADEVELYRAFGEVIAADEGYPQEPGPIGLVEFSDYWLYYKSCVIVVRVERELVGSYYLKPNYPGRGAHIANAGYFVAARLRGRGIGSVMLEHSMGVARDLGFDAMQFNLVFESNPARRLYERFGFELVGRVPEVIGAEAARVYWRKL